VLLLGALLFSFNWKVAHTIVSVNEVELWDALPTAKPAPKKQIAKPKLKALEVKQPEPEVKQPEPEPEPKQEVAKPEPEPETPKVDIELEKKKKAEAEKKKKEKEEKEEKKKKEAVRKKQLAALQKELLDDIDPTKIALKKLQAEIGNEDTKPAPAVNQGVVNEYVAKIIAKVHGNVNRGFCTNGNPELVFEVNLLPTGDFGSSPVLSKSSGNATCDDAVERALIASEPFPLPTDPDALSEFRNLNLTFKPNE
jgi:colicin import membrane protein